MKIFKDAQLTEEVQTLDFGIVDAGDTKEFTYYLYNDSPGDVVQLKAELSNKEVLVIKTPSDTLKSKASTPIVFSWTPPITIKKGLKSEIKLKYYELYQ
jgi:hypothetical protein